MTDILLSAFLLSVILLGIHSFFGLEIIRRGIIFTDLAIGQMAAFGAAISIYFFNGNYIYPISLLFALLGGISISVGTHRTISHEAFIGLLYSFGISGVFLVLSKSSHGLELFDQLMASDILFTPFKDILQTGVIYALLGLILYFFYPKTHGMAKDILFFIIFSITVTSSVRLAGVLVVFALLVAPAYISLQLKKGKPLFVAWIIGTVVNIIAISTSYNFDLPTGYTLVFSHAFLVLTVSILFPVRTKLEN